jgi:hypothetical protein
MKKQAETETDYDKYLSGVPERFYMLAQLKSGYQTNQPYGSHHPHELQIKTSVSSTRHSHVLGLTTQHNAPTLL